MKRLASAALAAVLCAGAHGAPFADPTRPPHAPVADAGGEAAAGAPRLESVLIAPNRRLAVISGRTVALNGTYNGRRVVRITESEVELRDAGGSEILKLFPNVDKQARARRAKRPFP